MRPTSCRKTLEVLFFALFLAGVEGIPVGNSRLDVRQQEPGTSGMVRTVTKINNEAGQTLTETCLFWPATPTDQTCSTTVTRTTDEDRNNDGQTNTIWPDQISADEPATQNFQQANPTSVVLPSVLFPTAQISESSTSGPTIAAILTVSTEPVRTRRASDLLVAETQISTAATADRSAAAADDQNDQIVVKAEESAAFPGQHLAVLPIGLAIYCSLMGSGLLVVFYMTLVRMKYRREYRQRMKGVGMGLGVAMGVGMGLDGRFAAAEVRTA